MSQPDPTNPRARDPRFPDRPTHPDFVRLSETVQTHDAMTEELGLTPIQVVGVDEESLMYFMRNRMAIASQRMHRDLTHPRFMALYLDAFALGKAYAESMTGEVAP